ncbi:hypothetical protein GQ53DRAFT_852452, partial [Thozetella sp. PMI_491]
WGKEIHRLCSALKDAPKEVVERVVRADACWMRISVQLDFSRRTVELMDDSHRALHQQALSILLDKLQVVHRELDGLCDSDSGVVDPGPSSKARRIKYAFRKKRIDEAIEQLEAWQGVFDISWFLTLKIAGRGIDNAVVESPVASISTSMPPTTRLRAVIRRRSPVTGIAAESVFLREDGLAQAVITPLPFCNASISVAMRKEELLILDRIECPEPTSRTITKDVRSLAENMREIAAVADSFGWLQCKGVTTEVAAGAPTGRKRPLTTALTMLFQVPSNYEAPMSLRAALLQGEDFLASLSDIVKLAKDLARAVSYMHIFGFVHKNIRPETALLLRNKGSPSSSSTASTTPLSLFLVGFEKFRSEDGITYRAGDQEWAKSLYRHPRRQGLRPEDAYVMRHDIYSLGVCLLELGLWESFIQYDEAGTQVSGAAVLLDGSADAGDLVLPSNTQAFLLALAENKLPRRVGSKYAEVVKTCLTCMDEGNKDFGNEREFEDEDGIVVGVKYVEKVCYSGTSFPSLLTLRLPPMC